MELVNRIFNMAVDNTCKKPSESLYTLYEQIEATDAAEKRMSAALEELGLDEERLQPVSDAFWHATFDYERQGFVNGFRFGMMLYRELLGTVG